MKTRVLYFTIIAAALSFSCQKEIDAPGDNAGNSAVVDFVPGPGRILAVSPTGTDSKVTLGDANEDGSFPVLWTNKDAIQVYSENNPAGEIYTYTTESQTGASLAVFTGAPVEGTTRYAVFPSTRAKGLGDDGKLKVSFGALRKQEFHTSLNNNKGNLKYMPMWATESEEAEGQ